MYPGGHGVGNWGNPIEDYEKYEILKGDPMADDEHETEEKVSTTSSTKSK